MDIVKFSVTNFRSITSALKIPISDVTVLIGKNNEGKSNLLKAFNIAMHILRNHALTGSRGYKTIGISRRNHDLNYNWNRDFPISLQKSGKKNQSIFRLEFELTPSEIIEFKNKIKSNLNGTLPIEIKISKDRIPSIKVMKRGKGTKTLNSKSKIIADYIAKKIIYNYIPAVRTEQEAMYVVTEMLSTELSSLEEKEEYLNALQTIRNLQTPILEKLSKNIKDSLSEFIPQIKDVDINIQERQRRFALRKEFEIVIDDGNKTNLEYKGDGVKSLAALGLLKNISQPIGAASIIAIEEPESHLHPGAIHTLKDTIFDLTEVNQVIISTHNPLFVNRDNIKGNIVINNGTARSAKNIKEIRDLIGVKASDNLVNASFVLVVEGEADVVALKGLLPKMSEKIAKAIKNDFLVIDKIGGTGNLSYKLSLLKNSLCSYHVLLDNDKAGRDAFDKAKIEDDFKEKDCNFINCRGMNNSEFEDCFKSEIYSKALFEKYGIILDKPEFRGNSKWSDRMQNVFLTQGKRWTNEIEAEVKQVVAQTISKKASNDILCEHKRSSIDALVKILEMKLNKMR
jgi:predicted ATP-dependent endonuclease of OLD family